MITIHLTPKVAATSLKHNFKDTTAVVKNPINLDIRELIREFPIPVNYCAGNVHQQADKVAVLLSQVVDRQSLKKSMNPAMDHGYVRLNSKILQSIVKDYNIYLTWMESNGILECDHQYSKENYSKAYRLGSKFRGKRIKDYVVTDRVLVGKLKSGSIDQNTKVKYPDLYNDLMNLEIGDFKAALKDTISKKMWKIACKSVEDNIAEETRKKGQNSHFKSLSPAQLKIAKNKLIQEKINSWQNSLSKIHEKQFYFKQDQTSFRLHTSAVSVKKELRKHFRINGEPLVACDISNSQPYFSLGFFLNPKKFKSIIEHYINAYQGTNLAWVYCTLHIMLSKFKSNYLADSTRKYIDLVSSGHFYEFMALELQNLTGKQWSRDEAKKAVFDVLFCPPKFKSLPGRQVMKKHFPEVLRFFSLINYGFTMTKSQSTGYKYQGNFLARILQNMESQVVLDIICKELKSAYPDIPLITLHDGIATTLGNEKIVKYRMMRILKREVGIKANVDIEYSKWGIGRYPS